jgi:hypothetical protein
MPRRFSADHPETHPEPEYLARFSGAGEALEPDEHARIGTHVAGCAQCRSEVRAIERFGTHPPDPRDARRSPRH